MKPEEAVIKAVGIFGSKAALASALKLTPANITQWIRGDRKVPPARAAAIEKLTDGAVSRADLCPSFWNEIAA